MADELADMAALVQRDRSHPSVILWSFCNEVGCLNETAAAFFRAIAYKSAPEQRGHTASATCIQSVVICTDSVLQPSLRAPLLASSIATN